MQYQIEILSHAMQGAAGGFLLVFAALSLSLLWRHRRRQRAAQESLTREHFATYQEPLPHAFMRAAGRSSSIPVLYIALCGSAAVAVAGFLALAYSPWTYFPNFQDFGKESKPGVELTTLRTDFESALMKVDGEVTNISGEVLSELHVHLILYDQNLRPVAVYTIDIEKPLAPGQIMPFFFSEARSDAVRRVGVTFSSRFGPLPHRGAAGPVAAPDNPVSGPGAHLLLQTGRRPAAALARTMAGLLSPKPGWLQ